MCIIILINIKRTVGSCQGEIFIYKILGSFILVTCSRFNLLWSNPYPKTSGSIILVKIKVGDDDLSGLKLGILKGTHKFPTPTKYPTLQMLEELRQLSGMPQSSSRIIIDHQLSFQNLPHKRIHSPWVHRTMKSMRLLLNYSWLL